MGLIDRAEQDHLERFIRDEKAAMDRSNQEKELERRRIEVITSHLETVAAKLDEPLVAITETPVGLPRYYVLGDVVIMVTRFLHSDKNKPDPSRPTVMTFSYCTHLMALDAEKNVRQLKIGTLTLLSFDGIARTINETPKDYILNASAVRLYIPQ